MKRFETLAFNQEDANKAGGLECLRKMYERVGFYYIDCTQEMLVEMSLGSNDGPFVLIMERPVLNPISFPLLDTMPPDEDIVLSTSDLGAGNCLQPGEVRDEEDMRWVEADPAVLGYKKPEEKPSGGYIPMQANH